MQTNGNAEPPLIPDPKHRRQVITQIYLPMILFIAIVIFAGAISAASMDDHIVTKWSHLSLIFLILIAGFIGLVLLVILVGLIYAIQKLLGITPSYSQILHSFFFRISILTRQYADKMTEPVLAVKSWVAGFTTIFKR